MFNANLRQLIFPEIEKIEINVRCRLSNYFAEKYGVLGYFNENNFADVNYHKEFLNDINQEIHRNSKAPFVKNFKENYEGGELPIYALEEVLVLVHCRNFIKICLIGIKRQ